MNIKPTLLTEYPICRETISHEDTVFIHGKLDGWRCIIDIETGFLYSRNGNILSLPHIENDIKKSFADLPKLGIKYVDGELYVHGFALGKIASMIRQGDPKVKFYCFDIAKDYPYRLRNNIIKMIVETENIRQHPADEIRPEGIDNYFESCIDMDLEGAVVRVDGCGYIEGRTEKVLKLKRIYD